MASIRTSPNSPYYIADMRLWVASSAYPKGGYWKATSRSTKVPITEKEEVAKKVADEMEKIGRDAAKTKVPAKQFFESSVAALMRAANIHEVFKTTTWVEVGAQYIESLTAGENSARKYEGEVKQFTTFLKAKANHDLRAIEPNILSKFHAQLIAEGRSEGTARNTCKTIRRVFNVAIENGYLEKNPAAILKLKNSTVQARDPFTAEDMAAIFHTIDGLQPDSRRKEWRIACLFGLYYGLRIGDAVNRSGEEIHIENGIPVIRFVPQKKQRKGMQIALPLVGELRDLLLPLKGAGLLTPSLAAYDQVSKGFITILNYSKITIKRSEATGKKGRSVANKTFHSWRHTANSLLAASGADSRIRQLICDHDDEKMNARYTHASVQTMAEAITKATEGLQKRD